MRDKHGNNGTERPNCASTLPDSYEEISKKRSRSVIKIDARVMELIHGSGATFTLYEKYGNGYVGCLMDSERDTIHYEVEPSKVVGREIEWPDSECQFVELAVLPLLNTDWLLTYYDEEHTKRKMYHLFNGERLV